MGVNTWAAFAGTSDDALVVGDFVRLELMKISKRRSSYVRPRHRPRAAPRLVPCLPNLTGRFGPTPKNG
jgi:hypothetical protein